MTDSAAKVAFLVAPLGIEQVELTTPWKAVKDSGATPVLISTESGQAKAVNNDLDPGDSFDIDAVVGDVSVDDFAVLVLPGGALNPDTLRQDKDAVTFVHDFVASGKPVAAICHAPWTLIEARVVEGRKLTSFTSVRTDLENAGAHWVDEACVIDGNLITSRNPDDLEKFSSAIVEALNHGAAASA